MSLQQDGRHVWVTLSLAEMLHGANVGTIRFFESMMAGHKAKHGQDVSKHDPLVLNIQGAIGELVVSKTRNLYFMPTVNTFKAADLGKNVQVRLRTNHDFDLIIRDDDDPEHIFVHVTGAGPKYCVRGWCYAKNVMKPEYRKSYGGRVESWFVPEEVLHPFYVKKEAKHDDTA